MTAPIDLVIFDCDGVLVDSEPIAMRVLLDAIREAGVHLDPEFGYSRFLGLSLASITGIVAQEFNVDLDGAALGRMRARLAEAFRAELRPILGIAETIARLPAAYCVASSSQPERIEVSLRVTGLWPLFEGRAFSATMVAHGKPAPDLFLFTARSLGYDPMRCLVVEDSPPGIQAARAAGMRVAGFLGGSHAGGADHRAAIAALEPDWTVHDMTELIEVVAGRRPE